MTAEARTVPTYPEMARQFTDVLRRSFVHDDDRDRRMAPEGTAAPLHPGIGSLVLRGHVPPVGRDPRAPEVPSAPDETA
ncbi:hypothetical protein ACFWBR_20860 [Streptomyces sp. NPDC060006]|uniref:hypothetical protein n=1 Tax=unclassified Streptomyces TaxID=2593676 RepID=UPI003638E150